MLDFNRTIIKAKAANDAINEAIDGAIAASISTSERRHYLGASAIGHECLRKIQWDWTDRQDHEPRTDRIFKRGHWWEGYCADLLADAGFKIVRTGPRLEFSQLDGQFCGHGDGMIIAGPEIEGVSFPALWECKGLGSKGWNKLSKEGLAKAYPAYADQVALYQAYLDLTESPAIFTAANMDTMEILHLLVPFDAVRAQQASDRALTVVQATRASETLPRVAADESDWRCKFCSHNERCWA